MMSKVTVYVPAYNAERTLERCLESIHSQTIPFEETLVIDDGSTDRTGEIARMSGAEVVRNDSNRGLAFSRNAGVSRAKNSLVASVDSDCILDSKWLEVLLPYMREENVACAGGALYEMHTESLADLWRSKHMAQNWGEDLRTDPPFLYGCNTISKKEAIVSVGGYSEPLRTNGEDVDISQRLKDRGWVLLYEPRARASHLQRDTMMSAMARWWRWYNPRIVHRELSATMRNGPRYVSHGIRYAFQDLRNCPQLVPVDIAFPFVQMYLDARRISGSDHEHA